MQSVPSCVPYKSSIEGRRRIDHGTQEAPLKKNPVRVILLEKTGSAGALAAATRPIKKRGGGSRHAGVNTEGVNWRPTPGFILQKQHSKRMARGYMAFKKKSTT